MHLIFSTRCRLLVAAVAVLLGTATAAAEEPVRPVRIRVQWGGGTPRSWTGRIGVGLPERPVDLAPARPLEWQTLCHEPDAARLAHALPDGIAIHQPRPIANDGVELTIPDWPWARIRVELSPSAVGDAGTAVDVAVADLLDAPHQQPLDGDGNRLSIAPAPSEPLHVTLATGHRSDPTSGGIHRPGDILRFRVDPLLPLKPGTGDVELRVRLSAARQTNPLGQRSATLVRLPPPTGGTAVGGRLPTPCAGVDVELPLPPEEGVYEVTLEAIELRGLRWTKPLASRVIQVASIAGEPAAADPTPWSVVYELDPGSPRLHERLRRLPARGLSAVPMPAVPLPAMPLPTLSRPAIPLPRLPDVPVSLPDVSAMVPRLGGLLASGHSTIASHPLGPMLQLPPATASGRPSWEAITIASAREAAPLRIEIDYPSDQRSAVAVCVLEADAAGGRVEVRHAGGFAVDGRERRGPATIATHRLVFWPTSRSPVLVIANPNPDHPVLVGRVRVLAGPARLPAAEATNPAGPDQARRSTYALFPDPALAMVAGGQARSADGGRSTADWLTHVGAIRHVAETVASQGLAGAVVPVFADGAALWPTGLTRQAPRWRLAHGGPLDPEPADLLTAVAAICQRERLAFIPSLRFNAALPMLEAELTGDSPTGIVCVGGDGRPRQLAGGPHYNILDPRVQQAVESVVGELGDRLRAAQNVTGIAIELPHDGWLHLPGAAFGLDDLTFGRFLAAIGEPAPPPGDEGRYAERARLVRGPLRQEWLAWRTAELSGFYARLANLAAGPDGRRPLYVVPTSLFTTGDVAARFSPRAAPVPVVNDDLLREVGLVAALPRAEEHPGRLVFMSPHVGGGGAPLAERAVVMAANASPALAQAAREAAERGIVILPRPFPVDLADVVPHGPFGSATAGPPAVARVVAAPPVGDEQLAAALAAADASVVFDMRPALADASVPPPTRRAWELLPTGPARLVSPGPGPLVVRSLPSGGRTWLQFVNAADVPAVAVVSLGETPAAALDAVSGAALPCDSGRLRITLGGWDVRTVAVDQAAGPEGVSVEYSPEATAATERRIDLLRQRLRVLHDPQPLDVLDNPGFELGLAHGPGPTGEPAVTGWEILEVRRGSLALVPGVPPAAEPDGKPQPGRGLEFTSFNGLSTLRSNPFAPPKTGRISVAAWLRVKPGDPQPPLRIAVEGVEDGREYYRFAPIGGLSGGRPLSTDWSLFVLQVDDLPPGRVDSMRVRFDLLGPGSLQLDDVRVYDLAFDQTEQAGLAKEIARIDHLFRQGNVGGAIAGLAGHWPGFLEAFVSDEAVAAWARQRGPTAAAEPAPPEPQKRQGTLDRLRGWWQ